MNTNTTDGEGPKVVAMPAQKNEAAAAGERMRREIDAVIENAKTIARYRRAAFIAYVSEGFSEPQALELCCK